VEDADEVAAAAALGAALVIAPRTADVPPSNEVVLAPVECIDGRRWPPASPFVRSRRRARFGLPAELVIEIGTASAPTMDDAVAATTLALASSGVVVGPLALPALALGLPTVTDDATARWLGATDGVDVLVRPTTAARTSAEDLGRDLKLAARLSSAAVALVRCDHDVAVAARVVVDHLTAARGAVSPTVVLRSRLAELESPLGSLPSQRAVAALIGLGPATARLMMAATTW
jgi:hypothetical protein